MQWWKLVHNETVNMASEGPAQGRANVRHGHCHTVIKKPDQERLHIATVNVYKSGSKGVSGRPCKTCDHMIVKDLHIKRLRKLIQNPTEWRHAITGTA